jgi:hypothetical protein
MTKVLCASHMEVPADVADVDELNKAASNILNGEDIDTNMRCVFGFKGLKNTMHTILKKINKPQDKDASNYDRDEYISFFGDIKFALNEFNRVSAI